MQRRFRLQPVLNYRQDIEEALQLQLAVIVAEERSARERLDHLRGASTQAMDGIMQLQRRPRVDVPLIEQGFAFVEVVDTALTAQNEVIVAISERADAKRGELIAAMQQRKTMEKLKERHDRAYEEWAQGVEQRTIDDVVTGRYNRGTAVSEGAA